jgi:hypothetical protein
MKHESYRDRCNPLAISRPISGEVNAMRDVSKVHRGTRRDVVRQKKPMTEEVSPGFRCRRGSLATRMARRSSSC